MVSPERHVPLVQAMCIAHVLTLCPCCADRYAKYYKMDNGTDYRTLLKAYAIRFDVLVNGNVSVFNALCVFLCDGG